MPDGADGGQVDAEPEPEMILDSCWVCH